MTVDWQFPVFSTIYLTAHVLSFNEVNKCSPLYNYSIVTTAFIMFSLSASIILSEFNLCKSFNECISVLLSFTLPFLFITCGVLLITNKTFSCIPAVILRLDAGLLIVTNFIIFIVIIMLCFYLYGALKRNRERKEARAELDKVYENIMKKDFNINAFLKKYAKALDERGMSDKDLTVLKDQFSNAFEESQEGVDTNLKKVCAVCMGDYEKGELVVMHPLCHHQFHWECLQPWLKRPNFACGCPLCKKPTLSNMLTEIRMKRFGDVQPINVDPAQQPNNNDQPQQDEEQVQLQNAIEEVMRVQQQPQNHQNLAQRQNP